MKKLRAKLNIYALMGCFIATIVYATCTHITYNGDGSTTITDNENCANCNASDNHTKSKERNGEYSNISPGCGCTW